MPSPQPIQIFLRAGNARGMLAVEITTRIVRVIEVPRSLLADRPCKATEATLGQPIFEPLTNAPTASARQSCSIAEALAPMAWASTPLKGLWCSKAPAAGWQTCALSSTNRANASPTSCLKRHPCRQRARRAVHYLFFSPSMASVALQGRSANGWAEWKDATGRTRDEVKRQRLSAAG